MKHFKWLILFLLVASSVGCVDSEPTTTLKPDVTFEISMVAPAATDSTKEGSDPQTGEVVFLEQPPVVVTSDVITAGILKSSDEFDSVHVTVSDAAGRQLAMSTAVPGRRLAIEVNGKVVSMPVIQSRVSTTFQITPVTSEDVDWPSLLQ